LSRASSDLRDEVLLALLEAGCAKFLPSEIDRLRGERVGVAHGG